MKNDCLLGMENSFSHPLTPKAVRSLENCLLHWSVLMFIIWIDGSGCPRLAWPPHTYIYTLLRRHIYRHFSLLMQHRKSCFHNKMWYSSSIHARLRIFKTAAGTAMCTNNCCPLTSTHRSQEPPLPSVKPWNYEKKKKKLAPVHSSIPKHTLSSPLSLLMSALQFKTVTLLSHMIYSFGIAG